VSVELWSYQLEELGVHNTNRVLDKHHNAHAGWTCKSFGSLSHLSIRFRSFLSVNDPLISLFLIPLGILSTLRVLSVGGALSDLDLVDSFWFAVWILAICQLFQVLDCKWYWLLVFLISTFLLVVVMTENFASASDALGFTFEQRTWLDNHDLHTQTQVAYILALATYELSSSSSPTQEGKRMDRRCRALICC